MINIFSHKKFEKRIKIEGIDSLLIKHRIQYAPKGLYEDLQCLKDVFKKELIEKTELPLDINAYEYIEKFDVYDEEIKQIELYIDEVDYPIIKALKVIKENKYLNDMLDKIVELTRVIVEEYNDHIAFGLIEDLKETEEKFIDILSRKISLTEPRFSFQILFKNLMVEKAFTLSLIQFFDENKDALSLDLYLVEQKLKKYEIADEQTNLIYMIAVFEIIKSKELYKLLMDFKMKFDMVYGIVYEYIEVAEEK